MATGDVRIGLDGDFNYGTAGTTAATTADNVDDVSINMSKRFAEWIRRGKVWVGSKPTVREATLEFKVLDVEGDAFLTQIETAWVNDTRIALYAKDDAAGKGLDADWYIGDFKRDESNTEAIVYNVTAKPTDELRVPSWG